MEEKTTNEWEENIYNILDHSIILHLPTVEFLIKQREWDALILFLFYCYCSKIQRNTKRVWASNDFVAKNLKWRKTRLLKAKNILKKYNIINVVPLKEDSEKRKGVIKRWLVEIKPLLNIENIIQSSRGSRSRGSHSPPVENGNHSSIEINNKFYRNNNIYNNINKKNLKKLQSLKQKLLKKEMLSPKSRTKAQEEASKQLRKKP